MGKQQVKYFVVDAFTDSPFKGNPAAVCLLEEDKDEKWLQAVAAEFNISETCYLTSITGSDTANLNPRFSLRWFTPVAEVKLCGHATLAAAHTLFSNGLVHSNIIEFDTLSGILNAKKVPQISKTDVSSNQNSKAVDCFLIELNFPSDSTAESNSVDFASITKALNGASTIDIRRTTTSDDLLVVLPSAKAVTEIQPQFDEIVKFPGRGVIVTGVAPSESGFDFYSRFFCPKFGINEDPVCGSAHCALTTYWSKKLGKCDLMAYQVDSFTPSALKGNPVAACLLNEEKDKKWLPSVAAEYNVSESIYSISITFSVTVNSSPNFQLRWFTPVAEGVSSIVFAILINERIQISKTAKAKDSFLIESIFLVSRHLNSSLDVDQAQVSKVMNVASIIDVKRIIT